MLYRDCVANFLNLVWLMWSCVFFCDLVSLEKVKWVCFDMCSFVVFFMCQFLCWHVTLALLEMF